MEQTVSKYPRVTLLMVMSVNGVVAQKKVQNSFEWNSVEDREQFLKKIKEIGTVLMGANTYRSIGGKPYHGIDFYVMTHQADSFSSHQRVNFKNGNVRETLSEIAAEGINSVALLGGPGTNAQCLEEQLVDDIFLTIEPLIMPEGMHIATDLKFPVAVNLESTEFLNRSKTLLLHYTVRKAVNTSQVNGSGKIEAETTRKMR